MQTQPAPPRAGAAGEPLAQRLQLGAVAVPGTSLRRTVLLTAGGAIELSAVAKAQNLDIPAQALEGEDPVLTLLQSWDAISPALREALKADLPTGNATAFLTSPLRRPGKIICVGLNYADHARETGQAIPTVPILFGKWGTTICGPGDAIVRPEGVTDLDYEAELGVVIGRTAQRVSTDDALAHVAAYVCANDVSARAAQLETGQWIRGKSFDTFCPIGPALVDAGGIDPQQLRISCDVDGEVRQDSSTAQMIFGVAELVSYLSHSCTLEPGDLILTGTPPGVAMGRTPSPWLQPGQTCTVSIEHLGRLSNPVVEPRR